MTTTNMVAIRVDESDAGIMQPYSGILVRNHCKLAHAHPHSIIRFHSRNSVDRCNGSLLPSYVHDCLSNLPALLHAYGDSGRPPYLGMKFRRPSLCSIGNSAPWTTLDP